VVRATVPRAAYVPAQSLMRISSQVAQVAANPLGGFVIVVASARGAFLVAAAILVAAAMIARLGIRARTGFRGAPSGGTAVGETAARGGLLGDSLRGMREVFTLPLLRRLLLLGWVIPLFSVAPESLAAPYIASHGGSAALVGWWLTGLPAGIVLGDMLGVWFISPAWQRRLVGPAGIVSFLPYLLFFLSPPVYACIPLLVASGMCGLYSLGMDARVRASCPEGLFARMMAVNSAGLLTIQALGFPLAGLIAGLTSPGTAVGIAGACGIAGTLLLWPHGRQPTTSPQEVSALAA
jgi:hypothetical protein